MPLDPYAPCPGGTGKKIKFCCSDLLGDLEQIDRLVEGDQISAALEQVTRLSERHPGRPCLLATRTKLELASKKFAEASATSRVFLEAFPENPLALGHAAVAEAIAGRIQEAAALFDRARGAAAGTEEGGASPELVRIAATLVQAGAQAGHVGFAQGLVDWLNDRSLGSPEERRLLAAVVGASGIPPALRTRVRLEEPPAESPWRFEFNAGLGHARDWRLSRALTTFRSLKGVAGDSRAVFTNIALLCEMLARPFEAAEAWLKVASIAAGAAEGPPATAAEDAVEATGRAIALETEADEDRSPQVHFERVVAPLPPGDGGPAAVDLLEDKLRHDGHCEPAPFERSEWVSRGAVPPRSVWRIYERPAAADPVRLLASLLVFGRQTDREPEALLQGFAPDVAAARSIVESLLGCRFADAAERDGLPITTPTNWLLSAQFRLPPPTLPPQGTAAGAPSPFDEWMGRQRDAVWQRFLAAWPDTPLPELLGKTPREAVKQPEGRRRVEALLAEGEATSRRRDAADAWAAMRERLGLPVPPVVQSTRPLQEIPPPRWHRVAMGGLAIDQLRGLFLTAMDAGFDLAAERAAEAILARGDAAAEDRWEALGFLEERAQSTVRKLEIIGHLREIAQGLKANDGMIDVAELRVRLQRGDQTELMRLLDHLRRDHSRDQKVLESLAEVLVEAGVDLTALAPRAAGGGPEGSLPAAAAPPATGQPQQGGIWTPGGQQGGPPGEKKAIWTPG
ncbi:MAG: hypothetical protein EBZ59_00015 [Planctomycetia bacterium]|nr:hypothetical protein [Planctomycetia bacterium]